MGALQDRVDAKVLALFDRMQFRTVTVELMSSGYNFETNSRSTTPERSAEFKSTPVLEDRRALADDLADSSSYVIVPGKDSPFEPTTACFVVADGRRYKVVKVVKYSAGVTPAAWRLDLQNV